MAPLKHSRDYEEACARLERIPLARGHELRQRRAVVRLEERVARRTQVCIADQWLLGLHLSHWWQTRVRPNSLFGENRKEKALGGFFFLKTPSAYSQNPCEEPRLGSRGPLTPRKEVRFSGCHGCPPEKSGLMRLRASTWASGVVVSLVGAL